MLKKILYFYIELILLNSLQAFFNRGMARFHLNHPKCIQDFNKALQIKPTLFEAFLARACVYGLKDRVTKAILNCNEAVKICPKSVRAYLYRGALKLRILIELYVFKN